MFAVRRAAALNPATAMTPPPPPDYSKALGAEVTNWRLFDQQTRMILRQIIRWPGRAAFTTLGVAIAGALLIGTLFFLDAMAGEIGQRACEFNEGALTSLLVLETCNELRHRLRARCEDEFTEIVGEEVIANITRDTELIDEEFTPFFSSQMGENAPGMDLGGI